MWSLERTDGNCLLTLSKLSRKNEEGADKSWICRPICLVWSPPVRFLHFLPPSFLWLAAVWGWEAVVCVSLRVIITPLLPPSFWTTNGRRTGLENRRFERTDGWRRRTGKGTVNGSGGPLLLCERMVFGKYTTVVSSSSLLRQWCVYSPAL